MIVIDDYNSIISELLDELPDSFFLKLTGGVIVSEELKISDYALRNDRFIMGAYQISSGMRQIIMYKGSFDRVYPHADAAEAKDILRGILRHEFRHHLESLGGVHGSDSLEAEDEREKLEYLSQI